MPQTIEYRGESTLAVDAMAKALLDETLYSPGDWFVVAYTFEGSGVPDAEWSGYLQAFSEDENSGYITLQLTSSPDDTTPIKDAPHEVIATNGVTRLVIP